MNDMQEFIKSLEGRGAMELNDLRGALARQRLDAWRRGDKETQLDCYRKMELVRVTMQALSQ